MRLVHHRSPVQLIELAHEPAAGIVLRLDDVVQFQESDEFLYHESLAVMPMLFVEARRIFVGGGGDGLALARLLRFPEVERVVLCDYDPAVTRLAADHPAMRRLNRDAMRDPRAEVVNDDARAWLERSGERFDLVVCDFPDPYVRELGAVYSAEFYALVRSRLAPDGVVVVQTRATPECARVVRATLESVFPHVRLFHPYGHRGFTLAATRPLEARRPVPTWCRYLDDEFVRSRFTTSRAEAAELAGGEVNRDGALTLVKNTLLELVTDTLVQPYPYRERCLLPWLGPAWEHLDDAQVSAVLEGVRDHGCAVVLVAEALKGRYNGLRRRQGYEPTKRFVTQLAWQPTVEVQHQVAAVLAALPGGALSGVEARWGAPADHPEVLALLDAFLARHGDRFFEVPGSSVPREREGLWLLCRDRDGVAVGLFKLIGPTTQVELELAYGVGTPEQNVHAAAMALQYCAGRLGAAIVSLHCATPAHVRLAEKLGAVVAHRFRVHEYGRASP